MNSFTITSLLCLYFQSSNMGTFAFQNLFSTNLNIYPHLRECISNTYTRNFCEKVDFLQSDSISQPKPIRRKRYNGKYPKKFEEKYKELLGNSEVIEKVLSKGGTPAGQHVPIMLTETIMFLNASRISSTNCSIFVDCTLGYGGHFSDVIKNIIPNGGVALGIDQDLSELSRTESRIRTNINNTVSNPSKLKLAQQSVSFIHGNFRDIKTIIEEKRFTGRVTSLLADLGFSSMQIDNPLRGFTYKFDGPLDMRMNTLNNNSISASELIQSIDELELSRILAENSDEQYAELIAHSIKTFPYPQTTIQLADCVRRVYAKLPSRPDKNEIKSAIARTMQAIRIAVNDEFGALESLLNELPNILAENGRVVILTFHSGEDRRVKKAFKSGFLSGVYSDWGREVVRASMEEQRNNPRSKCAKLRWAVRSDRSGTTNR